MNFSSKSGSFAVHICESPPLLIDSIYLSLLQNKDKPIKTFPILYRALSSLSPAAGWYCAAVRIPAWQTYVVGTPTSTTSISFSRRVPQFRHDPTDRLDAGSVCPAFPRLVWEMKFETKSNKHDKLTPNIRQYIFRSIIVTEPAPTPSNRTFFLIWLKFLF